MTIKPKSDRQFDVIVFGATGFTGRLVAEYLQKEYGSTVKWAMAGRSGEKLEAVRDEMGVSSDVPLIVADSADAHSLSAMASLTKVVLTTVGPYQLYGTDLVGACVANGTDYVDLCGEPAWMRDIIEGFDGQAIESGARIVLSCGFDSIPFDMGVYFLQEEAKRRTGRAVNTVRGRVRKMKGTFSGGTAASFKESMKRAMKEPHVLEWLKDPFSLTPDFTGAAQPAGHKPLEEPDLKSWSAPFIMAAINTKNVHRSNVLMDFAYGKDFKYSEMVLTGPGEQGEKMAHHVANDDSMSKNPPKPGEGPSKEERETGFYDVMFVGDLKDGDKIIAGVTGDKDPGYGSTSKMIAEAALTLALDVPNSVTGGGVYTPAPAMGRALIERLTAHAGLTFKIEA